MAFGNNVFDNICVVCCGIYLKIFSLWKEVSKILSQIYLHIHVQCLIYFRFQPNLKFLNWFEKVPNIKFNKIRPVGAEFSIRKDGRAEGRADMANLTVGIRNFAKASKNVTKEHCVVWVCHYFLFICVHVAKTLPKVLLSIIPIYFLTFQFNIILSSTHRSCVPFINGYCKILFATFQISRLIVRFFSGIIFDVT
jgi:hypothetical protein